MGSQSGLIQFQLQAVFLTPLLPPRGIVDQDLIDPAHQGEARAQVGPVGLVQARVIEEPQQFAPCLFDVQGLPAVVPILDVKTGAENRVDQFGDFFTHGMPIPNRSQR